MSRCDPVLHIDGGYVQVVTGAKDNIDITGAVIRTSRSDVVHAFYTIDLLLKRNGDRRLDHVRISTDVVAGHRDLWRSQSRIERNGKRRNRDCTRQNDQQRANCSKYRSSNKKIYHQAPT